MGDTMFDAKFRYQYLGTSTQDRCKRCNDCISLYRNYQDGYEVFFCQNCGYGFHMYKKKVFDGVPNDFHIIERTKPDD